MSKNTGNTQFRKLNVNPYSDDEEEEEPQVDGEQGPNEGEVSGMLGQYPSLFLLALECQTQTRYLDLIVPTFISEL